MPRELDSCVRQVRAKGKAGNPWAVCRASLGSDEDIEKRRGMKKSSKRTRSVRTGMGDRPK